MSSFFGSFLVIKLGKAFLLSLQNKAFLITIDLRLEPKGSLEKEMLW